MLNFTQNEKYKFNLYFPNQIRRNPKLYLYTVVKAMGKQSLSYVVVEF